jgi:hypothetical protein
MRVSTTGKRKTSFFFNGVAKKINSEDYYERKSEYLLVLIAKTAETKDRIKQVKFEAEKWGRGWSLSLSTLTLTSTSICLPLCTSPQKADRTMLQEMRTSGLYMLQPGSATDMKQTAGPKEGDKKGIES